MSKLARPAALSAAAIAAAGLSACSASVSIGKHLNNPEKLVSSFLRPTPKSVNCPDDIADKAGTKFTCHIVAQNGAHDTVGLLEPKPGFIRLISINGRLVGQTSGAGTGTSTNGTGNGTSSSGASTATDTSGASTGTGTDTTATATGTGTVTIGTATASTGTTTG